MRGTPRLSICACENLLTGFLPIAGGADPQYDNRFNDHRSPNENSAPLSVGARRYAVPLAASSNGVVGGCTGHFPLSLHRTSLIGTPFFENHPQSAGNSASRAGCEAPAQPAGGREIWMGLDFFTRPHVFTCFG